MRITFTARLDVAQSAALALVPGADTADTCELPSPSPTGAAAAAQAGGDGMAVDGAAAGAAAAAPEGAGGSGASAAAAAATFWSAPLEAPGRRFLVADPQLRRSRALFPCVDSGSQQQQAGSQQQQAAGGGGVGQGMATYELHVTVPPDHLAVCDGELKRCTVTHVVGPDGAQVRLGRGAGKGMHALGRWGVEATW